MISFLAKRKRRVPQIRIAIYDSFACAPRVITYKGSTIPAAIEDFSQQIYNLSQERGGQLPFSVIKELVENLLHAHFCDVVVTIYPEGNTIRFSDRGPGISDPDKAFQPGFSSASKEEKKYIKGVGSGLPVAKEALKTLGGQIVIEENLDGGTVVTISLDEETAAAEEEPEFAKNEAGNEHPKSEDSNATGKKVQPALPKLTKRQLRVFMLITEVGEVGPSFAADKLGLSLTTAFRELSALEEMGLVETSEGGKRCLTSFGMNAVPEYIK